ncbi:MAG: DUF1152 domain-containing protein, partial [Desulfurococcaceae archaeon]
MEFLVGKAHHIMFLALGGGGDVASASMLALAARRLGFKSHVASVVWERLPVDPTPGPVRLSEVVGSLGVGGHSMLATGESKALRGGKSIDFQAANASRSLGEPVGLVDLASGAVGVRRGVEELSALYG